MLFKYEVLATWFVFRGKGCQASGSSELAPNRHSGEGRNPAGLINNAVSSVCSVACIF